MKTLPKYFVVKHPGDSSDPKWMAYIKWLVKEYGEYWEGTDCLSYYGYDGNPKYRGTNAHGSTVCFENNPTVISLDDMYTFITAAKGRFPFQLKEVDAKRIIDAACITWKPRLEELWAVDLLRHGHTTIEEKFYMDMREACTKNQNTLFDEIFGKDGWTLKDAKDGEPVWVSGNPNGAWLLRYADGSGLAYEGQRKQGAKAKWAYAMPFDPNNLPVNKH